MRKSIAGTFLLLAGLGAFGVTSLGAPEDAEAQQRRRGDVNPGDASRGGGGGTPVPGTPSDLANKAKQLLAGDKFQDAAIALCRVASGESSDDEGNKQIAQFDFAKALYSLRYYQGAYAIFSAISEKPNHIKYGQTLYWLAKLANELPEPADVVERVGHYDTSAIEKFNNNDQHEMYWQLNYLLGRYKYRVGQEQEALTLFGKVDRRSKYYVQAQFFSGISNVKLRQSKPAVQSFQRILGALENDEVEGVEDVDCMRDLAHLSMARTFYSSSVKLDDATNQPTVDPTRLSAAVKYWNQVETKSEYWLDALFEESWAYFMAGDYSHALGNIHTIQSPYFPNSYYPEADILKAVVYFANCQYEDATTIVSKFRIKYDPIFDELVKILEKFQKGGDQDEAFFKYLKDVQDKKANFASPTIKVVVENSLSDRQLLRNLEYVRRLDEELQKYERAKAEFKDGCAGRFVHDSVVASRKGAVQQAGELARGRYQRNLEDLIERIRDAKKILADITQAKLSKVSEELAGTQVRAEEADINIVQVDDEHLIWPFNGEYWRDELGFYRQSIASKCGR